MIHAFRLIKRILSLIFRYIVPYDLAIIGGVPVNVDHTQHFMCVFALLGIGKYYFSLAR